MAHDPLDHLNNLLAQSQAIVRELVRDKVLTSKSLDALVVAKGTILFDVAPQHRV